MYKFYLQQNTLIQKKIKPRLYSTNSYSTTTGGGGGENNNSNKKNFIITILLAFYFVHLKNR